MRYAKYKPTGIAWLPEVPEGWECCKLRQFLTPTSRKGYADKKLLSVTREQGVIVRDTESKEENHNFIPEDLSNYKLVEIGDFAVNKMKSWQGSYGVSQHEGIVSPAYYTFKVSGVDGSFFSAAIRSRTYVSFFARYSKGIRVDQWDLSAIALRDIPFALPPLPVQRAIVAYLDEKCGKVDRLVAAKEKEVALLKELKQSMIAEAVTHGVRPMRRLVSSGIPWLPEIPEGWKVKRAKYLFRKEQRPVQAGDEIVTCFRDGEVTLRKNRRVSGFTEATDYSHYQHICAGDLVIHQMDAFAGSCGVSDSDGMGTPVLSVCTPKNDRLDVRYFAAVVRLMGLNGFIQSLYRGIRERSSDFRFETFAKQELPIPPLAEQREIVAHIEARAAKIDAAVMGLEREVAALREYKQRLIADVVTGQRKVA